MQRTGRGKSQPWNLVAQIAEDYPRLCCVKRLGLLLSIFLEIAGRHPFTLLGVAWCRVLGGLPRRAALESSRLKRQKHNFDLSSTLDFHFYTIFCLRNGQVMCISTSRPFSYRVKDLFSGIKEQGKDIVSFLKMTKEFKMQVCK